MTPIGQLLQLETIQRFRCEIAVWLELRARPAPRSLSLDGGILRGENQDLRKPDPGRLGGGQFPATQLPELKAKKDHLQRLHMPRGRLREVRGSFISRGERVLAMADTRLRGSHNAENLMAALGVSFIRGLSFCPDGTAGVRLHATLPHRCEILRTVRRRRWVNDSKRTNPDSVEKALRFETRPVVLIVGDQGAGFYARDGLSRPCRRTLPCGGGPRRNGRPDRGHLEIAPASGQRRMVAGESRRTCARSRPAEHGRPLPVRVSFVLRHV